MSVDTSPQRASPPCLLDEAGLQRILRRLGHELREHHRAEDAPLVLVGIRTRGHPLAVRLAAVLAELGGCRPRVAAIDVTAFRDDRPRNAAPPEPALDFDVTGCAVVVVDDVAQTGRSLRAGIDAVLSAGRPRSVELLVLIDRGHRELPLKATYVGRNVPAAADQRVQVALREVDRHEGVWMVPQRNVR